MKFFVLALAAALLAGAAADGGSAQVSQVQVGVPQVEVEIPMDDLPKCATAKNCFECFQQQECYTNPFGTDPICSPCGWCSNGTMNGDSIKDDIMGLCAVAPTGIVDFCPWVESANSHLYCPTSVCTVGDFGCSCASNDCPAMDKIIAFLTVELFYACLVLVLLVFGCSVAVCVYIAMRRQSTQHIVVIPYADLEERAKAQVMAAQAVHEGSTQDYSRMS
mmetsp:Transcript_22405/g.55223  ORF Transcript_22405/g.55223 Transcript_22405/m.55223 type:complete len:220 (-) Transcript_22405:273-932(-)|eukprot:CAMPEP_0206242256 /NCGR_PEP_ID=MMETSP0047_2-20121206/16959_1 /ASSEMBLY_ACC=CAM_ASM_000192 /TAXON_ID=195065 /ORGANISM="Chroomonas mesostigmatica_cf, Strain CCMP1168" /LENGTH=219 /DNA_ID=CAMNT_0053667261 /DNA_START=17 /DNA_END=676 /DNA_ORIENTATION=-